MAKSGQEIVRSKDERLLFSKVSEDTNGEFLEVEVTYKPRSPKPPEHYHPFQEERFEVLRGTIHAKIGEEESTYQAGDAFVVPAGCPHWMHNVGDERGKVRWQTRPALKTEAFFETIWGLARDGKIDERGLRLMQAAVIGREYTDEFRLTNPPFVAQRLLFTLLAPIGRFLGYRAKYQ